MPNFVVCNQNISVERNGHSEGNVKLTVAKCQKNWIHIKPVLVITIFRQNKLVQNSI